MRALLAMAVIVAGCRTPTQYRIVVRNEVPCPARVVLRVDGQPRSSAGTCGGASDDVVIVPKDDNARAFTIELATRTDGGDPSSCTAGDALCIVQTHALSFREHESLELAVTLAPERPKEDTGPPPPVTVRIVNAGTIGVTGSIDACVRTTTGMSQPLLKARGVGALDSFEVSSSIELPADTGDVITMALTTSGSCDGAPITTIKRPQPGGRLFAMRKGWFEAVLVNDVLPAPSVGVTIRALHASSAHLGEAVEVGARVSMMDVWPKELTNIAFANLSPAYSFTEPVALLSARTAIGSAISDTGVLATKPDPGRTYTVFVLGEEGGGRAVRICDDQLESATTLRALCLK